MQILFPRAMSPDKGINLLLYSVTLFHRDAVVVVVTAAAANGSETERTHGRDIFQSIAERMYVYTSNKRNFNSIILTYHRRYALKFLKEH